MDRRHKPQKRIHKYRYQHLGDHLHSMLTFVTAEVDRYITNTVAPTLIRLGDVGCHNFKPNKECVFTQCMVQQQTLCKCSRHRKEHLKIWKQFMQYVDKELIVKAVDREKKRIDESKAKEPYDKVLKDIITDFGKNLRKNFVNLQDIETRQHDKAIERLIGFKKDLSRRGVNSHTQEDCVKMFAQTGISKLQKYATSLGIIDKDKDQTSLAHAICREVIC